MRSRILPIFVLLTLLVSSIAVVNAQSVSFETPTDVNIAAEPVTLTLLHNNDGESSLLPLSNTVEPGTGFPNTEDVELDIGSVAAFKTLTDENIAEAVGGGNAVLNVYAGDAFLPSATLTCSVDDDEAPVYDALAQSQIDYDAHIFGNHEFDYTPSFLERFIRGFDDGGIPDQPFLSANLDFSAQDGYADLIDADGLITDPVTDGRVIGKSAIVTDTITGELFGIVGATTPRLREISSPDDVEVLADVANLVQTEVDRLTDEGVNKIVLVSHLQSIDNDRELIGQLTDVDIAVAGGGDELLLNTEVPTQTQLLPGEGADIEGEYPLVAQDADEKDVYIVTTAGNYKYLGRLDVNFDADGLITEIISESSYPRPVIPESDAATELELTNTVVPDPGIEMSVVDPVNDCLALLNETPVVSSEVVLDVSRDGVRGRETNAGNLITDSFLEAYDQNAEEEGFPARSAENPVIAIQNGGGIRQNAGDALPVGGASGVITRRNTIDVLPFANFTTVVTDVTPADLETIFELSVDFTESSGQFLQVAGMSVVYDLSQPVGSRVISLSLADDTAIIEDGEVVDGAPTVTIVTNSFTAGGGDGYETLADNPNKTQLPLSYEQAWRNYLEAFDEVDGSPTISAEDERYQPGGEGRITFVQQLYLPFVAR